MRVGLLAFLPKVVVKSKRRGHAKLFQRMGESNSVLLYCFLLFHNSRTIYNISFHPHHLLRENISFLTTLNVRVKTDFVGHYKLVSVEMTFQVCYCNP